MVTINGNEITLALGIIAALLIISSIAAILIKDLRHERAHRDEESALNAETDNASIELLARGFSLLRTFNRAGYHRAGALEQPIKNKSPSRASPLLRSLSGLTRFRSKRATPMFDMVNQVTENRSPSAAEIRDGIQARNSIADDETADTARTVYRSREQQWTQVALESPLEVAEVARLDPPTAVSPLGSDLESDGNIERSPVDARKMAMESTPEQQYRAFRGPSGDLT